ncbi:tigger transposable element-derived protein 4-like [Patiria miniata]|uniref:HTH CENPB-type domain-containing protein n=1 Tax=Patiria miniata TaxID=46514 RepID=A0A914BIX0_PATMI|nr:tigger transposable element-derived protein 4-like [Patiria miniata]
MASNSCSKKRKLETKTYKEKYKIVKFCEANPRMRKVDLAQKFGLPRGTLYDILKNKDKIIEAVEKPDARKGGIKRVKQLTYDDVNSALIVWFRQKTSLPDIRIDGEMLLVQARKFAADLGHEEPEKLSPSWIERFKARWGIGRVHKAGESDGVDRAVVTDWKEGKLQQLLEKYQPEDIYNADETGLFWQLLPENSLGFKGQSHHRRKEIKTRITLLVCANMDGSDKLPLYAIGKNKKPRAFKNVCHLPITYTANKKAWMTSHLFDKWLKNLDDQMGSQGRKIAMVVDNCPAHPQKEYENIKLVFPPPNTTSCTQPMNGGVIKNLKTHYRRILAAHRLEAARRNSPFKWDLLDALFAVKNAWGQVTQATIANCFRGVGFVCPDETGPAEAPSADDAPQLLSEGDARQFRNIWNSLADIFGQDRIPSLGDYVDIDAECGGNTQELTDEDIVKFVTSGNVTSDMDAEGAKSNGSANEVPSEPAPPPSIHEAFKALDVIRRFALSSEVLPASLIDFGDRVETFLVAEMPKRMKQSQITDFF